MYKFFSSSNTNELVEKISAEGFAVKKAEFFGGILSALCEKTSLKGKLYILQGYNTDEIIEKINVSGDVIENSILSGPVKFFFVREKTEKAKAEKK